jgi:hypothetical protein
MAVQTDILGLISDHAVDLLSHVEDPCGALRRAAREFARIGLGVPLADIDDTDAFVDRLIADNTLLYIRTKERAIDLKALLATHDFRDLIGGLVERLSEAEEAALVS